MTNSGPRAEDPGQPPKLPIRWEPDELRFFGITLFLIACGLMWLLPEKKPPLTHLDFLLFLMPFALAFGGVVLNIWALKLKQIERDANASKFQPKQVSPDENESTLPKFSLFLRPFSVTGQLKSAKRLG